MNKYPYVAYYPFSQRLNITEFFVEHAIDMVILAVYGPKTTKDDAIVEYGFMFEEDVLAFKLKFGFVSPTAVKVKLNM